MSYSHSHSNTSTYTEARAKNVMGKVYEEFHLIAARGFRHGSREQLQEWKEDVFYIMTKKCLDYFQIQFKNGEEAWAVQYKVSDDGTIFSNNDSGEIDYWQIPKEASVSIVVRRSKNTEEVDAYLRRRGWRFSGKMVTGDSSDAGAFSKDGFGLNIQQIGPWDNQ